MSRSSSWPDRPTNGSPRRSSSRPGPSPTTSSPLDVPPVPKTTVVRDSLSRHAVHDAASAASAASVASPIARIVPGSLDGQLGDPRLDPAEHLPADRPERTRPVVGGDDLVALSAEQDDLVADRHVVAGTVDEQLVHGDDAGNPPAGPAGGRHCAPATYGAR